LATQTTVALRLKKGGQFAAPRVVNIERYAMVNLERHGVVNLSVFST
jgi:hypothetical protein